MGYLVSIDETKFFASMSRLQDQFGWFSSKLPEAVAMAMVEFAQYALSLVQAAAPRGKNKHAGIRLADDGFVIGPLVNGDEISVSLEWRLPYALIQDKGGVITPKNFRTSVTPSGKLRGKGGRFTTAAKAGAARLFIPLRPGVHSIADPAARKAAGYKYGVDYVFAKFAVIPGTGFITKTLYGGLTSSGVATQGGGEAAVASGGIMGNAARDIGRGAERILEAMVNGH